jgi:hypothetical protein
MRLWHPEDDVMHVSWGGYDVMTEHGKPIESADDPWGRDA